MSGMKTVQKYKKDKIFNENLILQWQIEKMAKCVISSPAQLKMVKFFEIGHNMANLATLR